MGLVGLVLVPVASQMSVDYMDTRDFAMRPRQWLALMSQTKATISFSPSFGYELCARRLREGEAARYDLSNWRVAGIGAEMIRSETLDRFAEALAARGLRSRAPSSPATAWRNARWRSVSRRCSPATRPIASTSITWRTKARPCRSRTATTGCARAPS